MLNEIQRLGELQGTVISRDTKFFLLLSLGLDIQYLIVTTILSILYTQMTTSKLSNNPEPENSTQIYFSLSFPFLSSLQPPTLFFKHH